MKKLLLMAGLLILSGVAFAETPISYNYDLGSSRHAVSAVMLSGKLSQQEKTLEALHGGPAMGLYVKFTGISDIQVARCLGCYKIKLDYEVVDQAKKKTYEYQMTATTGSEKYAVDPITTGVRLIVKSIVFLNDLSQEHDPLDSFWD